MAEKIVRIEISGEDVLIDAGLDSFARAFGWSEESGEDKESVARKGIADFFRATIANYDAEKAAREAKAATLNGANSALDGIKLSLSIG